MTEQSDIALAVDWEAKGQVLQRIQRVLSHEGMFLNTSSDVGLLEKILSGTERIKARPTDAQMDGVVKRAAMSPLFV